MVLPEPSRANSTANYRALRRPSFLGLPFGAALSISKGNIMRIGNWVRSLLGGEIMQIIAREAGWRGDRIQVRTADGTSCWYAPGFIIKEQS